MFESAIGTPLLWSAFFAIVLVMLALDLGVFHRHEHVVKTREAAIWTAVWISLSLAFNAWIWWQYGSQPGLEFLTGYLIEKSLSVDNIFVFIVIFQYFRVPEIYHHRVLFWGILGALVMRGIFIGVGAALVARFDWVLYVFGAFLVYTGLKILKNKGTDIHPEENPVLGFFRRFVPMTNDYRGKHFVVHEGGAGSPRRCCWCWWSSRPPTWCSRSIRSRRSSASPTTRSSSSPRTSSPSSGCAPCTSCSPT